MIRNILEIVIYELQAAIATRRALMVIGLYLASGIIGSVAFEYSVNVAQDKLIQIAVESGAACKATACIPAPLAARTCVVVMARFAEGFRPSLRGM